MLCVMLCIGATSGVPSKREATSTDYVADGTCTAVKTQTEYYFVFQNNWSSTPQQQRLHCELVLWSLMESNAVVFSSEVLNHFPILPSLAWFPKELGIVGLLHYLHAVCSRKRPIQDLWPMSDVRCCYSNIRRCRSDVACLDHLAKWQMTVTS